MAQKPISGIDGVLGGLITEPHGLKPTINRRSVHLNEDGVSNSSRKPAKRTKKLTARRGRPPGPNSNASIHREKVTLRIDGRLVAEYREQSWRERCQLGELVERALEAYWRRNWQDTASSSSE